MFITIISDCTGSNEVGRQASRIGSLFGVSPTFVSVSSELNSVAEMEVAGNLIDVLDATRGGEGVVLVNTSPRSGGGKRYPNGSPFGYFWVGKVLICSTIPGFTLSLVKKLSIASEIMVLDVRTALNEACRLKFIKATKVRQIVDTQFRSFEFLPLIARWISGGFLPPRTVFSITEVPDMPPVIWHIDSFGNCKTSLLRCELPERVTLLTCCGSLALYDRLRDVPDGQAGLVIGSSGFGEERFIECVVQGKSASREFGLSLGQPFGVL